MTATTATVFGARCGRARAPPRRTACRVALVGLACRRHRARHARDRCATSCATRSTSPVISANAARTSCSTRAAAAASLVPRPNTLDRRAAEHDQSGDGAAAGEHARHADTPLARQRRSDRRLDPPVRQDTRCYSGVFGDAAHSGAEGRLEARRADRRRQLAARHRAVRRRVQPQAAARGADRRRRVSRRAAARHQPRRSAARRRRATSSRRSSPR